MNREDKEPARVRSSLLLMGALLVILASAGCRSLSEQVKDPAAGMNGGFEVVEKGLPVNWLVYSPRTVADSDFDLLLDREEFKEGEQALRFDVRDCSDRGGWASPGISQEYSAEPGKSYRIHYWIKSDGSRYGVRVGGVSAKTGSYETIESEKSPVNEWRLVEREFVMPEDHERIRFEMNVRSPGSLWIDDIRIEPSDGEGGLVKPAFL